MNCLLMRKLLVSAHLIKRIGMMNSVSEIIAARLAAARKIDYGSARGFALAFAIPVTTYSQHETGKRALGVAALLEYSEKLKISPAWILTGKGLPYPNDQNGLEKQAALYQHLSAADKGELYCAEQSFLIQGEVAEVDVPLLTEVLKQIMSSASEIKLGNEELVSFALDTYNSVVQTSASLEDKSRMVGLSINSLIRGGSSASNAMSDQLSDKRA